MVLVLSAGRWVTAWTLLAVLAVLAAAAFWTSRARTRELRQRLGVAAASFLDALHDPAVATLALAVALATAYAAAVAVGTPQNSDDALYYHLTRAALWKQHHGVAYLSGPFDARVNGSPPNGEVAMLFTMVLGSSGRYAGLVQLVAYLALALGTVGLAGRLGLARDQALFSGLVVATLPVVVLQSSAALNDVTCASLLVAAVFFALSPGGTPTVLAGLGGGLALGTKVPAVLVLPLVAGAAFVWPPARLRRVVAIGVGAVAVGAYWYVVNLAEQGSLDGGVAGESDLNPVRSLPDTLARLDRLAIDTVDLAGGVGRDRFVYAIAAAVLVAALAACARRRLRAAALTLVFAGGLTLVPLVFPRLRNVLDRAHFKLWRELGHRDLAAIAGHDLTRAGTLSSWFGPLLLLLGLPALALSWRLQRCGRLRWPGVVLALAPVYGLVVLAVALAYQDLSGRFLVAEVALAAAVWGVALGVRALAWSTVAVACATLVLTRVNDAERPAGVRLLEPAHGSIWTQSRAEVETVYTEPELGPVLSFVDGHVAGNATIALAVTPSDEVYPFFGEGLDRRLLFVRDGGVVPPRAQWLVIRPGLVVRACPRIWRVARAESGWRIARRVGSTSCSRERI
jgi:hypothetical protein